MKLSFTGALGLLLLICSGARSQTIETLVSDLTLSKKGAKEISGRLEELSKEIFRKENTQLRWIEKIEARIRKKLKRLKIDQADDWFAEIDSSAGSLRLPHKGNPNAGSSRLYMPYLDSLLCTTDFSIDFIKTFQSNYQDKSQLSGQIASLSETFADARRLYNQMAEVNIKRQMSLSRLHLLSQKIKGSAIASRLKKEFSAYKSSIQKYHNQFATYKQLANNPSQVAAKYLSKVVQNNMYWKQWFASHSQLSQLFKMPGTEEDTLTTSTLQTRKGLSRIMQEKYGDNMPAAAATIRQNVAEGTAVLQDLKEKIAKIKGISEQDATFDEPFAEPKGRFNGNKNFEIGVNFQTKRNNEIFPTTTDVGISIGYKLKRRLTAGVGGSYKIGAYRQQGKYVISGDGFSIRSFIDFKPGLGDALALTGSYELNYQKPYVPMLNYERIASSYQSMYLGLTALAFTNSKLIQKTKIQMLIDFNMWALEGHKPSLIFRAGYNF